MVQSNTARTPVVRISFVKPVHPSSTVPETAKIYSIEAVLTKTRCAAVYLFVYLFGSISSSVTCIFFSKITWYLFLGLILPLMLLLLFFSVNWLIRKKKSQPKTPTFVFVRKATKVESHSQLVRFCRMWINCQAASPWLFYPWEIPVGAV